MTKIILLLSMAFSSSLLASDIDISEKITSEILAHGKAYENLRELTQIGPRLAGSKNAAKAVDWAKKKMEGLGFDKVWLQPVTINVWERGSVERASVVSHKHRQNLRVTALGGSIGTGKKPILGQVVEVKSLEEASHLGDRAKGKIIFYNRPFDVTKVNTFTAYSEAVDQRTDGAWTAAKVGAIAVLVRSMTAKIDNHPHTGAMKYKEDIPKIPAAAISTLDAEKLSMNLKQDANIQVKLELSAHPAGKAESFNVIGELTGQSKPDEFVVVGGHLDSWDLAQGAQDDGAGCVQSIEVLRTLHDLGVKPRRSIRAVLFMNEESGADGGQEYAKQAKEKHEKHIAAIESDEGGFTPLGFNVQGKGRALSDLKDWGKFFAPIHADEVHEGHGGTDISFLADLGTPLFGLSPDSQRYFDYHHSEADTIDAVDERELDLGASALTILAWLISEKGI
jgi:hypothetical protein